MDLHALLRRKKPLLMDGAMGTMLQAAGLGLGESTELWSLTHPDTVRDVHAAYVEAGAQLVIANTFGANRQRLAPLGADPRQVMEAGVRLAREAAAGRALAALDLGPIGPLWAPMGPLTFSAAYALFAEQVQAGAAAGAEVICIETMTYLAEAKAALLAARENARLPVLVTMSFEAGGRTFLGCPAEAAALALAAAGADAVGLNCSLGPAEILPAAARLAAAARVPLLIKPNAGLPQYQDGQAVYTLSPAAFADGMRPLLGLAPGAVGGCCGTTPAHIRALAAVLEEAPEKPAAAFFPAAACGQLGVVDFAAPRALGQPFSATADSAQATAAGLPDALSDQFESQREGDAELIAVGLPLALESPDTLAAAVELAQASATLPVAILASDPGAAAAALRVVEGRGVLLPQRLSPAVFPAMAAAARSAGAALALPAGALSLAAAAAPADRLLWAPVPYGSGGTLQALPPLAFTPATTDDLPDLVALLNAATEDLHRRGIAQWELPWHPDQLLEDLPFAHLLRGPDGLAAVYFLRPFPENPWLQPPDTESLYLYRVALHPAAQRQGLGQRLLLDAFDRQASAGLPLYLDCWAGNTKLKSFYAAAGMSPLGDFPEEDFFVHVFRRPAPDPTR